MRVLMFEDDPQSRTSIAQAMGGEGHAVAANAMLPRGMRLIVGGFSTRQRTLAIRWMVPLTGLEPVTPSLRMRCSTS